MTWHVGARRRPQLAAARPEFLTVLPRGLAPFAQVAESSATAAEYLRIYVDELLEGTEAAGGAPVPAVLQVHWLANRHFELYVGRKPWSHGDRRSGNWLIMSNLREDEHLDARLTLLAMIDAVDAAARARGLIVAFDRIPTAWARWCASVAD